MKLARRRLAVAALALAASAAAQPPTQTLHAVVVAGSAGWGNYRHQADALHAYALLTARNVPPSQIILMLADDIAAHPRNPAPGTVINSPGGRDLRAGVVVDYSGTDVSAATLLAVLAGNATGVAEVTSPSSTRRVLSNLGPADAVLLFYSDHGGAGVLGMPSGPPLYGDALVPALEALPVADVVAVVEACEAGSLFDGVVTDESSAVTLPPNPPPPPSQAGVSPSHGANGPRLWALTAAAAGEPSWATFCPGPAGHDRYDTCLGDAFAVAWLADAEAMAGSEDGEGGWVVAHARRSHHHSHHHRRRRGPETLHTQFARVRAAVHGSHVSQYGAITWARAEPAAGVEGGRAAGEPLPLDPAVVTGAPARTVPQWAASGSCDGATPGLGGAALAAALRGWASRSDQPPPTPRTASLPWACLRRLADAWHRAGCGGGLSGGGDSSLSTPGGLVTDQSGLRHAGLLVQACEAGVGEAAVEAVLAGACGGGGGGGGDGGGGGGGGGRDQTSMATA